MVGNEIIPKKIRVSEGISFVNKIHVAPGKSTWSRIPKIPEKSGGTGKGCSVHAGWKKNSWLSQGSLKQVLSPLKKKKKTKTNTKNLLKMGFEALKLWKITGNPGRSEGKGGVVQERWHNWDFPSFLELGNHPLDALLSCQSWFHPKRARKENFCGILSKKN